MSVGRRRAPSPWWRWCRRRRNGSPPRSSRRRAAAARAPAAARLMSAVPPGAAGTMMRTCLGRPPFLAESLAPDQGRRERQGGGAEQRGAARRGGHGMFLPAVGASPPAQMARPAPRRQPGHAPGAVPPCASTPSRQAAWVARSGVISASRRARPGLAAASGVKARRSNPSVPVSTTRASSASDTPVMRSRADVSGAAASASATAAPPAPRSCSRTVRSGPPSSCRLASSRSGWRGCCRRSTAVVAVRTVRTRTSRTSATACDASAATLRSAWARAPVARLSAPTRSTARGHLVRGGGGAGDGAGDLLRRRALLLDGGGNAGGDGFQCRDLAADAGHRRHGHFGLDLHLGIWRLISSVPAGGLRWRASSPRRRPRRSPCPPRRRGRPRSWR